MRPKKPAALRPPIPFAQNPVMERDDEEAADRPGA